MADQITTSTVATPPVTQTTPNISKSKPPELALKPDADTKPKLSRHAALQAKIKEIKAKTQANEAAKLVPKVEKVEPTAEAKAAEANKENERRAASEARARRAEQSAKKAADALEASKKEWVKQQGHITTKASVYDQLTDAYTNNREKFFEMIDLKGIVKADPVKFLKQAGISYQELSKMVYEYKGDSKTPEQIALEATEARLAKFEADRAAFDQKTKEKADEDFYSESAKNAKTYLRETIEENKDKYEFLSTFGGGLTGVVEEVYKSIEDHFFRTQKETGTGERMEFEEALNLAEQALEEQYLEQMKAPPKKIADRLAKEAQEAAEKQAEAQAAARPAKRSSFSPKSGVTKESNPLTKITEEEPRNPYDLAAKRERLKKKLALRQD